MKLFASSTSPFARKCRIVIIEKGLSETVEIIWTSPFEEGPDAKQLRRVNPLNKIPALLLGSGETVFDSRVICEFLDGLSEQNPLIPSSGKARLEALTRIALADGILDAAFNIVMELRRPEAIRSEHWISRWLQNIQRAIEFTDWDKRGETSPNFELSNIGLVCALDYLDFRLPEFDLVSEPARKWRAGFSRFTSLELTAPDA